MHNIERVKDIYDERRYISLCNEQKEIICNNLKINSSVLRTISLQKDPYYIKNMEELRKLIKEYILGIDYCNCDGFRKYLDITINIDRKMAVEDLYETLIYCNCLNTIRIKSPNINKYYRFHYDCEKTKEILDLKYTFKKGDKITLSYPVILNSNNRGKNLRIDMLCLKISDDRPIIEFDLIKNLE